MKVENFRFRSGTGDQLIGDLYRGRRGAPLLLFAHGMLSNRSGKAAFMAGLAAASGCHAFTFDFGGCGESDGEFYPISYERRSVDLDAAIETALERSRASKLALVGSSMGGALAIAAGERIPAVGAVFALAPSDDGGALEAAGTLGKPLFIVHGDRDEIVIPDRSAGLAAAAGNHARRRLEPGAGHSLEERMPAIGPEVIRELTGILTAPGCYQLLVRLDSPLPEIPAGRNRAGRRPLPPGYYVYSGSGGNSLEGRVSRHIRTTGVKPRWHIDRLLSYPNAPLVAAFRFPLPFWPGVDEHLLHAAAADLPGASEPDPGFGSSDCRDGCRSHLVQLPASDDREAKKQLASVHKRLRRDC